MKRTFPTVTRARWLLVALLCGVSAAAPWPPVTADAHGSVSMTSRSRALSAPVARGDVVRLRWTRVAGAGGYELFANRGGAHAVLARPVSRLRVRAAHASRPGAVRGWETTGYQPLGYAATVGQPLTGAGAGLLSPLAPIALSGSATVVTTLARSAELSASRTSAYVRNTGSGDVRYSVAAVVHGELRESERVTDSSVSAASSATPPAPATITVDSAQSYQTMQGFGAALNDSSAYELTRGVSGVGTASGLSALEAEPALRDLFGTSGGISLSYVRVSVGGNDFAQADYSRPASLANEYTENDPAPGSTATSFSGAQLAGFISHDLAYQVPVLQAARALDPSLKIMAAPWTAPIWMKCENTDAETGSACQTFNPTGLQALLSGDPGYAGGALDPADVSQYADYLLEFILAYRAQGLGVSAISLGNEPANDTWAYPSMTMSPAIEARVAADLSADMASAGVSASIIGLDHNWNTTYPQSSAQSCGSACYVDQLEATAGANTLGAVGFHCYGGGPSAQDAVTLPIFETECSPLGYYTAAVDSSAASDESTAPSNFALDLLWDTDYLVMNGLRDGDSGGVSGAGSETVMLWNLAGDGSYGPTINAGCTAASSAGACLPVEELSSPADPTPQVGLYILGQLSSFVKPGAVRIGSTQSGALDTVAFRNPDGQIALVVLNSQPVVCQKVACTAPSGSAGFTVAWDGHRFSTTIPAGAVQTYVWSG